jgi:hypothetical protein
MGGRLCDSAEVEGCSGPRIAQLYALRWIKVAACMPGRTPQEVQSYWLTLEVSSECHIGRWPCPSGGCLDNAPINLFPCIHPKG